MLGVHPSVRHSLFVSCAHWVSLALLLLSVWSGLNLARDQRPWLPLSWVPGMQAVPFWHVLSASAWLALLVAYLYLVWKKKRALQGANSGSIQTTTLASKQAAHRRSFRLIYATGAIAMSSGLGLLFNVFGNGLVGLRALHLLAVGVFLAAVVWHLCVQWKIGAWRRVVSVYAGLPAKPQNRKTLFIILSGLSVVVALFLAVLTWWQSSQVIIAPKISGEISIDGEANEAQWKLASSTVISTYYGLHEKGHVPVEIKMMNDGYSLYIHAKWPDSSKSMRHLPLLKTAQGWQVQQSAYLQADESQFYEDKFAVMLGANPWDALRSVFLSPGEHRGGHRTDQKKLLDIWHWKSVRNHGFANLDDAYFSSDLAPLPGQLRYAWGYGSDPLLAGSYVENWDYFSKQFVRPLRLPRRPEMLTTFQNLKPAASSQDPVFGMHWVETQPYDASIDHYPVGTVLPSVVWMHPNEGDRADVRAAGMWKDGYWHLEMARNFETDSDYDRTITDGTYLWFASFDHSQTRHTYHLRPLRLSLGK